MNNSEFKARVERAKRTAIANLPDFLKQTFPNGKIIGNRFILGDLGGLAGGSLNITLWGPRAGLWCDLATGEGGDIVKLYAAINNLETEGADFIKLIEIMEGGFSFTVSPLPKPKVAKVTKLNPEFIRTLWTSSLPAKASVVENYLRSRGITLAVPDNIRLLPKHKHGPSGQTFPVMLAGIRCWPSTDVMALHRTWLLPNGTGKAPVQPNKMMLGPTAGGAIRLSDPAEHMAIAEGLETALSVLQEAGLPTWAALSTSGMRSLILPDLPMARTITIAGDNDLAGRKAAKKAADKWSKEGREVRIAYPPAGFDFNDVLARKV